MSCRLPEPCLCGAPDCRRCFPCEAGRFIYQSEIDGHIDRIRGDAKAFLEVCIDNVLDEELDRDKLIEIMRIVGYERYNQDDLSRRVREVMDSYIEARAESLAEGE